jgi:hypothetical protein
MSSEQDQMRQMAERIARRISERSDDGHRHHAPVENGDDVVDELASVRATLDELKRKLVHIEAHITREEDTSAEQRNETLHRTQASASRVETGRTSSPTAAHSPWLSGMYVPASHPSQEKFGVEEAAVSELVDFFESEKTCELEPGNKPCNHCAMCSSRGF